MYMALSSYVKCRVMSEISYIHVPTYVCGGCRFAVATQHSQKCDRLLRQYDVRLIAEQTFSCVLLSMFTCISCDIYYCF